MQRFALGDVCRWAQVAGGEVRVGAMVCELQWGSNAGRRWEGAGGRGEGEVRPWAGGRGGGPEDGPEGGGGSIWGQVNEDKGG